MDRPSPSDPLDGGAEPVGPSQPRRLRVLLVEDEQDHADLVAAYLDEADDLAVGLTHADTVARAVALLRGARDGGRPFDVVLCDQRLPDSEYWETVEHVTAAAGGAPVVALTSIGDSEVAVDAMRQGAQDYLVKSELSGEVLRRTLRYAVERARRTDELQSTNEALRQTLEHLRRMQAQIVEQEKLAGLGGLLAGVAHELRNPLHLTVGFARAAADLAEGLAGRLRPRLEADEAAELEELQANVRKVVEHGHRADAVLRAMFEHARGVVGDLQPVDLHGAIDVALAQALPAHAGVRVERDYDGALRGPSVLAAGGALARALYNVVENAALAVAAADGAGRIRVSTRSLLLGEQELARVEVEDDGVGITDEVRARVFEPFYTAWPGPRIGLGLTLAHSVVASHGGHIEVGPSPLGGAAVRIELPTSPLVANGEDDDA